MPQLIQSGADTVPNCPFSNETLSLALLAVKESAAAARIAANRFRLAGDKHAAAYESKAARMDAAADHLEAELLRR